MLNFHRNFCCFCFPIASSLALPGLRESIAVTEKTKKNQIFFTLCYTTTDSFVLQPYSWFLMRHFRGDFITSGYTRTQVV